MPREARFRPTRLGCSGPMSRRRSRSRVIATSAAPWNTTRRSVSGGRAQPTTTSYRWGCRIAGSRW
ncbi:hypothetical protein GBAR_LOCUS13085 [Geodia barretti]|uniref:Uncharacterized protein n=1 Tax=Geodia barretti TaxID=519541 RepID=A0AA35S419_GEOBA|nr:hypothetical protein GBAR_LOCUS13085 [Geodia barretti]